MKLYHEFCIEPMQRNGTFIPVSKYADVLKLEDSGYCSVYRFDEQAVLQVRAQGSSQGLGRFPVYTDRLWLDFDGADLTAESVVDAKKRASAAAKIFKDMGASFTIWFSGGKGYHICVRIAPMSGNGVPHSQSTFVSFLGIQCDYSLYQHGRLLSNPGRLHKKTGKRKELVHTHHGNTLLVVPYLEPLNKNIPDRENLTYLDRAKIAYSRVGMFLEDTPKPGMRHTRLWSLAMSMLEAGMSANATRENLMFVNSLMGEPKKQEEVEQCLTQALNQSRR